MPQKKEIRTYPVTEFRVDRKDKNIVLAGYSAVFGRALFNHNPDYVLGRQSAGTLVLREDEKGLFSEITLPDTSLGRDLAVSVERGDINQQSFGFVVAKDEWTEDREKKLVTRTKETSPRMWGRNPLDPVSIKIPPRPFSLFSVSGFNGTQPCGRPPTSKFLRTEAATASKIINTPFCSL